MAFDLDGTLLDDTRKVPERNARALRKAAEKGIKLMLCSGCTQLEVVSIPASVTTIAPDAFEGCEVIIVTSEGSQAQAFAEANGFTVALY